MLLPLFHVVLWNIFEPKHLLLRLFTLLSYPDIPTVFDNYSEEKDIQMTEPKTHTKRVRLDLWDTAGVPMAHILAQCCCLSDFGITD